MTSSSPPQMPRLTKGRQKIEMKKIDKESNLLVTFSKRRTGVFKKASELATLCGVEITIIVFSPTGRVYTFGHPSFKEVVERFMNQSPPVSSHTYQRMQQLRDAKIQALNMQLTNLHDQKEVEKKKTEELVKIRKAREAVFFWDAPIENLGVEELEKLKVLMTDLKKNAEKEAKKFTAEVANPTTI